ncbi:MAG: HD domain-containing protein [Defluviitaleaceae bacterium]|nr:HD domain-containing protein [Defluviitaleaceae bacterium]MCL2263996.1 HD domain-containing protein [Defluviitaleaceae bacterium]
MLQQQLEFLKIADELKNVERQTRLVSNPRHENSAEHSWHIALMALTLHEHAADDNVNLCRVIKMLLVHDLVEIYAGDVPAFAETNAAEKEAREQQAADKLFATLPSAQAAEYRALWEEFESMKTSDALYAAAIDRFQPFFLNHLTGGYSWKKFNVTAAQVYKRMTPAKTAVPKLWAYIETVVQDAVEKGYVKP